MAEQCPLRRWKRFLPAFGAIDSAIEAAPGGCSRATFRRVRGDLIKILCNTAGDEERAEAICQLLDQAMVEALETLRLVPVTPAMLTTTDVAKAVGDLHRHESERVRGLARSIFGQWRATIEGDLSRVRAALEQLSQIPQEHLAATAPFAGDVRSDRESTALEADMKQSTKIQDGQTQSATRSCLPAPLPAATASGARRQGTESASNQEARGREAALQGARHGRAETEEDC